LKLNSVPETVSSKHLKIYGAQAIEIDKIIAADPGLGVPFSVVFPYTKAEIIWICRNEMPVTLEDMLARRTRALFLDAHVSSEIAPVIAGIMAKEMGYDEKWQVDQIEKYNKLVVSYL
jgi:glycerol-3-phosphate dehydrogenase